MVAACDAPVPKVGPHPFVGNHAHLSIAIDAALTATMPTSPVYKEVFAQGVKQSVCPSIVVIGTKIARSRLLGIYACYKHNQSIDIGEKLVYTRLKLLKMAY